ncbi:MAG TPA: prepilin-type N-terminal cleavage/methylation domain-containing protein [Pyrinomonadaceae bacterium]|jgi:Tfp pilus assembly protein PilW|nr:prepilin-type N-terminal cleavage/methylation domain-containing protein [Pyrinomonadaceae bacterium]
MNTKPNSQSGFSLIELVIAMSVTIVIATIASTLVAQSFRMRAREDTRSDAIADAHRALNIVTREIANSGFGLMDNGIVPGDSGSGSIRIRANLNAYMRDAANNPVAGSEGVVDRDEDIKYTMYNDDAANRHYLVRYDAYIGSTVGQREATTVLANRLDGFQLQYFDSTGTELNVTANPDLLRDVWKVRLTVGVILPAEGAPESPGYQPPTTINLVSDVVLRNASQITF